MELYALTDNMILEKMGENIKRIRLEHNISQKELAASAGVAISSIAALERGESVSLKTLIPLLRALGSLHLLFDFLKEPEMSPIAYAKHLDKQKTRKRASAAKNNSDKFESEW
jgi:transcriptional regulator with XRE-family HTH domain